ncbi:MAG: C39 family peptidase [Candidatus Bathyarchaeia archaeon]
MISYTSKFAVYSAFGWSNGGSSSDSLNPKYGTHDWIAHHALDWLPQKEKWFIVKNVVSYLYGTELPDNSSVPSGIGDTAKHHVYYFSNGSLQDDASAVRAQEEYAKAVSLFKAGDLANASLRLGVVTHYISDVAVFGHVMGSGTDWGAEAHHSDYESYVQSRTDSYDDEFNVFLNFDGVLSQISAYDTALELAYDTTFGGEEGLTCVWMDTNYNWSNPTFKNRCGESLNLAVNLIADVLHTFYLEMQGTAHFIDVPFHYQDTSYYCGPACLEMVFDYYGEDINQLEIADVARTFSSGGTYTYDMRRAAHFSNLSTSMGKEMPYENITGYTLRKLGYAAFESHDMNLEQLKSYIDNDKPLILLMWYSEAHSSGHYRVVIGYNETHFFLHDPWGWGDTYGGPNIALSNMLFFDLWSCSGYWALYAQPWTIEVSAPAYIKPNSPFQVNATIAYPQAPPNSLYGYTASACNATITLPANMSLADGESQKKTIGTSGVLEAGANSTVSWMLVTNYSGTYTFTIEAEGLISGNVSSHGEYPAYGYNDRIGATLNFTRNPAGEVQPNQEVEIGVNVTDAQSGVKNVTLYFTTDDWLTWEEKIMQPSPSTDEYKTVIPGQQAGTTVKFKIVAYDYVGNSEILDGTSSYCIYQVVPEFQIALITPLFAVLTMLAAFYAKKRRNTETTQNF